jgi:hypothetical protein
MINQRIKTKSNQAQHDYRHKFDEIQTRNGDRRFFLSSRLRIDLSPFIVVVCGYDESKQESFETANKGFITGVP